MDTYSLSIDTDLDAISFDDMEEIALLLVSDSDYYWKFRIKRRDNVYTVNLV